MTIKFYTDPQAIGTIRYHTSTFKLMYLTDGVIDMAKNLKCYWLIDIVESYISKLDNKELYCVKFIKNGDGGTFTIDDGNEKVLIEQLVHYTDISENVKMFLGPSNSGKLVLMLPSEY